MEAKSRNYLKRFSLAEAIGGKATPVQCKNPIGFQLLSQSDQCGVSEIHRHVAISFHQHRHSLEAFYRLGHQLKRASQHKLEGVSLVSPARPDQVERFSQDGLCGSNRACPTLQSRYTRTVRFLVSIDKSHKGSRVEQKFTGHGVTGGSGIRDAAGLGQAARWQHYREDRARVQWGALPVRFQGNAPTPHARLQSDCAVAVALIVPTWPPNRRVVAWSIDGPFKSLHLQCIVVQSVAIVELPGGVETDRFNTNVSARADRVIR